MDVVVPQAGDQGPAAGFDDALAGRRAQALSYVDDDAVPDPDVEPGAAGDLGIGHEQAPRGVPGSAPAAVGHQRAPWPSPASFPTTGEWVSTHSAYSWPVAGAIRQQILVAAEECIRSRGMGRVTTKDIARRAGCSEGSIYNHFADKLDLFRAVITERLPGIEEPLGTVANRAGAGPVRDQLADMLEVARSFFARLVPLAGSVFADPELLARCRSDMERDGTGPHRVVTAVADYLRAEQALGRVSSSVVPEAAALLLVGAAYEGAYMDLLTGRPATSVSDEAVMDLLCAALVPEASAEG